MILNIDEVAANLTATMYPDVEVKVIRFRDLALAQQIKWLARARVLITTQASSSFGLVFLPPGVTCIMVGAPQASNKTMWKSFYELDHWFPLTYVNIKRYEIPFKSSAGEYEVKVLPDWWQPKDRREAKNWWLYNANVRLRVDCLKHILDPILQQPYPGGQWSRQLMSA
jgi:hypothetical protein